MKDHSSNAEEIRHPSENSWWASKLMVFWITPLIQLASIQSLTEKDLWPCPKNNDIEYSTAVVRNAWRDEQRANSENPSLLRALLRGFGGTFLLSGCYQFTFLCTQLAQPFLVGELVSFIATGNGGLRQGIGLAFALAAVSLSSSISLAAGLYTNRLLGVSIKAGVMMTVYEQALHLTTAARMQSSVGQTTNLVAIDSEKLFQAVLFCHFIWHGPVCCIVVMGILISQVGLAALVGLGFIFVLIPVQNWMADQIGVIRRKMVKLTDERVKLINEFLHAIRVVKYYAWEVPIEERVRHIREKEVSMLSEYLSAAGRLRELLFSAQPIAALLIFTTALYGFNRSLSVVDLFRLLAFLNITRFPLNLLGQALKSFNDAQVSLQRLNRFLLLPTLPTHTSEVVPTPTIVISDATFSWVGALDDSTGKPHGSSTQDKDIEAAKSHVYFSLKSINFSPLKANELIAIVGPVGSGKSSFLAALLKEMPLISGTCHTSGSISYCAQTPWIQNMTLRNNVLFGCDLESSSNSHLTGMYEKALTAAALRPDLTILPSGDETEIGEKGINLSGGQKSRVSIARALFSCHRSQIYLLDDPFSAVDGATGNWIFKHGLLDMLQDKLRLVALNSHLHLLKHFDRIIILEDGNIAALGTPAEIMSSYPDILERVTGISNSEQQGDPIAHSNSLSNLSLVGTVEAGQGDESKDPSVSYIVDSEQLNNPTTVTSEPQEESTVLPADASVVAAIPEKPAAKAGGGNLTEREKMAVGKTSFATYLKYFSASLMTIPSNKNGENLFYYESAKLTFSSRKQYFYGLLIVLGILFFFSLSQVARVAVDYLLARWAAAGSTKNGSDATIYYCSVGVLLLSLCVRSVYLNKFASWSSMQIHSSVLRHVLSAPIPTFFDTRTIGEILNRFSKDMETVDSSVPEFMLQVLINWAQVFSIFALCISVTPYFVLAMVPLGVGFYKMYNYFANASRDLKRLESITRSPIFSSLSETLTGLETIRAYGDTERFEMTHRLRMERNNKVFFHLWCCMSWVTARLEIATSIILFAIAILAVCLRESVSPISLGLALSFGLQLTALFQRCVQVSIDVSTYMTSTDRLFDYMEIPQERSVSSPHCSAKPLNFDSTSSKEVLSPPDSLYNYQQLMSDEAYTYTDWPRNGQLIFENVWMAYRDGPPVLRGINVVIESGQRVGICGRTGAGKSSILVTLFRIVELMTGKITYDGVDISQVPLQKLRQNLAIIPQDPVLLMGSIRFQLDPFAQHSDEEVWESLTQVNLAATVRLFPKGIHEEVKENAENLSQGQKQLLCIARALLRRTQILVVDEGTSAVDPQTDAQIQSVLREQAQKRGTTVLAIAHRLQTIIDFDKILVLGNGEVLEFDSPEVLLGNPDSSFSSMVKESKQ